MKLHKSISGIQEENRLFPSQLCGNEVVCSVASVL